MSTHLPGFQSFSRFYHYFVLAILATISIRVKHERFINSHHYLFVVESKAVKVKVFTQ